MVKNFFKIAWRNLLKDRQFTILNLVGLSVGLSSALFIWLWIQDELNVDKYNVKDKQLYQVMANLESNGGVKTIEGTAGILAPALKSEIPEVEHAVSVLPASWFPFSGIVSSGGTKIKAGAQYIGKEYFDVFTCNFIDGDKSRVLSDKNSTAISDELAMKLFHTTEGVIGKTIEWVQSEFEGSFVITGIFKKTPVNATDQFDVLLNYGLVLEKRPNLLRWDNSDPSTYVILKEGANINLVNEKIKNFVRDRSNNKGPTLFLARFSDKYLYGNYENGKQSGGRITYVKLFSIIAIFIIIIACINFMNLATAKAARRSKEVGIQKVVGARRPAIIIQYLCESVLTVCISLLISMVIVVALMPVFNQITGKAIELQPTASMVAAILSVTLLTGLLAGSYPALYLSKFKPVAVLKGTLKTSLGELWARKGLVVFQFAISVVFIASVLVVYRQINFIHSKNLGYNREHVIHFTIPLEMDSVQISSAVAFVNEVRNIPGVVAASSYYHNLTGDHGSISDFQWPGKDPNMTIDFSNLEVGYGFVKTAGIKMKEGRDFNAGAGAAHEIIFNEAAIKAMGLKDPVGKTISFWGQKRQIVGVAADFNFESLYHNIQPCFIQEYPVMPNVMVRLQGGQESRVIGAIEKLYARFNKGMDFEYAFLDDDYKKLYASEARVGILTRYFAGLAVIISCLGLFGLAAFTAQKRQKEIGIRKVVGASSYSVAFLLSKDFLKLIIVSLFIAFPVVWWTMNSWLGGFAYRIHIGPDIFLLTAVFAVAITLFAVSFQSLKAAMANPVKSLRSE
jgi:ABC-type antimicrobial peptide transport system permease subunit